LRARAALRVSPADSIVSHQTAALLWAGSLPPSADVHVRIPHGETMKVDGVRTHIGLRVPVTRWRGQFLITSPEATFRGLAQEWTSFNSWSSVTDWCGAD
jgi:hypothetical protein